MPGDSPWTWPDGTVVDEMGRSWHTLAPVRQERNDLSTADVAR
jgi:hypothetical protein